MLAASVVSQDVLPDASAVPCLDAVTDVCCLMSLLVFETFVLL